MQLMWHLTTKYEALFEQHPLREIDPFLSEEQPSDTFTVPASWSATSIDALLSTFADSVVPEIDAKKQLAGFPRWLCPADRDQPFTDRLHGTINRSNETSIEQVLHRLAGYLTFLAVEKELFAPDSEQADIFYKEIQASILEQKIVPQPSVLKQFGLEWAYGVPQPAIDGPRPTGSINLGATSGQKIGPTDLTSLRRTKDIAKEIDRQLSKETLSATPQSRLHLDIDHPHAADFIDWKLSASQKKAAFKASLELARSHIEDIITSVTEASDLSEIDRFNEDYNLPLKSACDLARASMLPENIIQAAIKAPKFHQDEQDILDLLKVELKRDHDLSAIAGSLAIPDDFMKEILSSEENIQANRLWESLSQSIWACGHPTLQFKDHIAKMHMVPASGDIYAGSVSGAHLFLDHSAQVGATLNLLNFISPKTGSLDLDSLAHCVRLWTIALDLMIDTLGLEDPLAIRTTQEHRPLALSYHNLAPTLMALGLAYDSDAGRATASVITALVSGNAYLASAELAQTLEAFPAWYRNQEPALEIIKEYRLNVARPRQGSHPTPTAALLQECPETHLLLEARKIWDEVYLKTRETGLRNAQLISLDTDRDTLLLLDASASTCDGDMLAYQEVLSENGWEKRLKPHILQALLKLGYSGIDLTSICHHILGYRSLAQSPEINNTTLKECGFTQDILDEINIHLEEATDLRHVFTPWVLGHEFLIHQLDIEPELLNDYSFDLLSWIGFSDLQIDTANQWVFGTGSVYAAPALQAKHRPIFLCAFSDATSDQEHTLSALAQIDMMAAVQPFLSGAIAHDLYLTSDCKIEDIQELIITAWQKGIKQLNLSRLPQNQTPILMPVMAESAQPTSDSSLSCPSSLSQDVSSQETEVPLAHSTPSASQAFEQRSKSKAPRARRYKLPFRRKGYTQKASIGGHKVYLRTGEYQDGSLGEIFLDMHKEGASFRSLLNNFAMSISIGLQYGVPLEEYVDAFTFTRFDPSGKVEGNDAIKMSTSVLDYIFRELAISYLGRDDLAHATPADLLPGTVGRKKEEQELPEEASKTAQRTLETLKKLASKGYIRSMLSQTQSPSPSPEDLQARSASDEETLEASSGEGVTLSSTEALLERLEQRKKDLQQKTPSFSEHFAEEALTSSEELDTFSSFTEEIVDCSKGTNLHAGRQTDFDNYAGLVNRRLDDIQRAKHHGYNGGQCSRCGSMSLVQSGNISMCDCCGKIKIQN